MNFEYILLLIFVFTVGFVSGGSWSSIGNSNKQQDAYSEGFFRGVLYAKKHESEDFNLEKEINENEGE